MKMKKAMAIEDASHVTRIRGSSSPKTQGPQWTTFWNSAAVVYDSAD